MDDTKSKEFGRIGIIASEHNSERLDTVPQSSPPAAKQDVKESTPEESRKELNDAIRGSNDILAKATTALTLLPDVVTLDRAKLSVTKHNFIGSFEIVSIRIEDILNVSATVGPLFGMIEIASRVMNSGPYRLGKFWKNDALKIKHITQGYVIALQRNIDCSSLPTSELRNKLYILGQDDH